MCSALSTENSQDNLSVVACPKTPELICNASHLLPFYQSKLLAIFQLLAMIKVFCLTSFKDVQTFNFQQFYFQHKLQPN